MHIQDKNTMKVAISALMYSRLGAEEAYRKLEQIGCPHVDIATLENWCHFSPLDIAKQPDVYERSIRELLEQHGLQAVACNMGGLPRDASSDSLEQWERYLQVLANLGITVVTIPSGAPDVDLAVESEWLTPIVAIAAAKGVALTIETHVGSVTERPEQALQLVERVPGLGLTLDMTHYYCNALEREAEQLLPYVRHVHIRDCGRGTDNLQVEYGKGLLELPRWLQLLKGHGYRGILSIEYIDTFTADGNAEPSVQACLADLAQLKGEWEG